MLAPDLTVNIGGYPLIIEAPQLHPRCVLSPWQWLQRLISRLPPQLRFVPYPTARMIAMLIFANLLIWAIIAIILHSHYTLSSFTLLSYMLGLRHALDANHISAIDLMTRRLVTTGSKPVTVGIFFSLEHSTIVIITCIFVAATLGALEKRFDGFRNISGMIGTVVSAGVPHTAWHCQRMDYVEAQPASSSHIKGRD